MALIISPTFPKMALQNALGRPLASEIAGARVDRAASLTILGQGGLPGIPLRYYKATCYPATSFAWMNFTFMSVITGR